MGINLRQTILDDRALKIDGLSGGIFLTYTLNLGFYEQIIAPAVDQAGCANILILADPDGYAGAISMGTRTIRSAGLRYVCVPIQRQGKGVQHAKLLLMAGPRAGRLLVGSGNLTMHGYGRNLEQFINFEYDHEKDNADARYPFYQVWKLLSLINNSNNFSSVVQKQLNSLRENAPWLEQSAPIPNELEIWHNFNTSLWDQLLAWRSKQGYSQCPLGSLQIISPYYDKSCFALQKFTDTFLPEVTEVYLDPEITNLDGKNLSQLMKEKEHKIQVFGLEGKTEKNLPRHLHAKAIVGREHNLVWCISGSANMTSPALLRSHTDGGNLELVTFQYSKNLNAFEEIFNDPQLKHSKLNISDIKLTDVDPSERTEQIVEPHLISELSVSNQQLIGKVLQLPKNWPSEIELRLLREDRKYSIQINQAKTFTVNLDEPIREAEAGRLEFQDQVSLYRWIDHPDALARYGARSYHSRIKGKLETFHGSESLFKELMNFLFERVELDLEVGDQEDKTTRRKRKQDNIGQDNTPTPTPPSADEFITEEELLDSIQWRIDRHLPYDRSLISLRDLLSLTLLQITTPTQKPDTPSDEDDDGVSDDGEDGEREKLQVDILDRLKKYLLRYCKKYGKQLTDKNFVGEVSPKLLFENHFTLGRVLIEFEEKAEAFTSKDLLHCFWSVWAPLVWPELAGSNKKSTIEFLHKSFSTEDIQSAWIESGLSSLTIFIMTQAFGKPPHWKTGIWSKRKSKTFLIARDLISRICKTLKINELRIESGDVLNSKGIVFENTLDDDIQEVTNVLNNDFKLLAGYLAPANEKYLPLIHAAKQLSSTHDVSGNSDNILNQIEENGLEKEWEEYLNHPAPIKSIIEGEYFCPKCFGRLTIIGENNLKRGKLTLCTVSRDAWIYQIPNLNDVIVI